MRDVDGNALRVRDTVDESRSQAYYSSALLFLISGKNEKTSGSFQASSRQFFIDPSDGE